jgi:hypothetical protein
LWQARLILLDEAGPAHVAAGVTARPIDLHVLEASATGAGTGAACPDLRQSEALTPTIQTIKPT